MKKFSFFFILFLFLFSISLVSSENAIINLSESYSSPQGIAQNNTFFWVISSADTIAEYLMNGTFNTSYSLMSYNDGAFGIAFNDTHFFVSDNSDSMIYVYWKNGSKFPQNFTMNVSSFGIAVNSSNYWFADGRGIIYKMARDGTYLSEFDVQGASPRGIDINETGIWIATPGVSDVRMNWVTNGTNFSAFDTGVTGNIVPQGVTQNGTYVWVSELSSNEIYTYYVNGSFYGSPSAGVVGGRGSSPSPPVGGGGVLYDWNPEAYFEVGIAFNDLFLFKNFKELPSRAFVFIVTFLQYILKQPASLVNVGGVQ